MSIPEELQAIIDGVLQRIEAEYGNKKIVVIMRGVPGSGLSTVANGIVGINGVVHSTDSFFMRNGKYVFDGSRLNEYHQANFEAFVRSIQDGKQRIIIDNTNIKLGNFRGYVLKAKANGYEVVEVRIPFPDPEVAAARNVQGIPLYAIQRMMQQFEE